LHVPANSGGEAGAEALDRGHPLATMRALAW